VSDSSQALAFHVDEIKITPKPKWPWLLAAALVLLLVIGGVVGRWYRNLAPRVPGPIIVPQSMKRRRWSAVGTRHASGASWRR